MPDTTRYYTVYTLRSIFTSATFIYHKTTSFDEDDRKQWPEWYLWILKFGFQRLDSISERAFQATESVKIIDHRFTSLLNVAGISTVPRQIVNKIRQTEKS